MEEALGLIQARIQRKRKDLTEMELRVEAHQENLTAANAEASALRAGLARLEEARMVLEEAAGITTASL